MSSSFDPFQPRKPGGAETDTPAGAKKAGKSSASNARGVSALTKAATARAQIEARRRDIMWPAPGGSVDGIKPGQWREDGESDDTGLLPEQCPVKPLGYDGEQYYFVDTAGQIFNTGTASMGVERVQKLFAGNEDFLCWAWPAFSRDGKRVTGFKAEEVRRDLYAACKRRGPFSMTDMVRGRGAWRDNEGRLILHCGEYLWYDGALQDTGEVGDHFYVRRPRSIVPWHEPVEVDDNPAIDIMKALRTWNFERGDIDGLILLGWMGIAMMGAALDWRPSIFLIGDAGSGKSELNGRHGLLRTVFERAMLATTNASEAGLYQLVGHDSLPIAIDEMEGDDAPDQARKIIKMARDAASGSIRIRGGSDHKGVEFQAQSTFMFSAINPPGIPPASLTRLAIIQLNKLKTTDGKAPVLKAAETIGPRLLRRVADGYADFPETYEMYRTVLRGVGHDSRGQNTFGTFLAAAHTLLGDEGLEALGLPFEDLTFYGEKLAADLVPELGDKKDPWEEFLTLLMTTVIDLQEHGQRYTVAQVLDEYRQNEWSVQKATRYIAAADIGLVDRTSEKLGTWLAIPNASRTIGKALRDTPYGSNDGQGNWRWALMRAPDTIVTRELPAGAGGRKTPGNRVSVAGRQERCLFLNVPAWRKYRGAEE